MGRARGKVLCVRVNPTLYKQLYDLAERNELVLSDLVRWILVTHFKLKESIWCRPDIKKEFESFVDYTRKPLWYR